MKKTFLAILATIFAASAFTGCVDDEQYVGPPTVADFAFSPLGVTPADAVNVSATITDLNGLKSVDLLYTLNGAAAQTVAMTAGEANKYTATIAAQEVGTVVELWIVAVNNKDLKTTTDKKKYTVSNEAMGLPKDLRINQVGSADGAKYVCIYNTSSSPVIMTGMAIYKNNEGIWGAAFDEATIPGNGYAVYRGKATEAATFPNAIDLGQNETGGVSGKKSILLELKDAEGVTVDAFCNTAIESPKVSDGWDGAVELPFDVAGRVPDGTGDWFILTDVTLGESNASATKGEQLKNQVDVKAKVDPTAPKISEVAANPASVKPEDTVTVSATVVNDAQSTLSTVVLKYKVGEGAFTDVTMTADAEVATTFSGVIPAQADKSVVTYKVAASNSANLTAESDEYTYTVTADAPEYDYTKLILNEVDGINKAVEIYNSGTIDIDIAGVALKKDDEALWTSTSYVLAAGAYVAIYQNTAAPAEYDTALTFTDGISAKKAVKIELFDPSGTSLGVFARSGEKFYEDKANSFSRVPDATGDWYYAAPTLGATNGVSNGIIGAALSTVVFNEMNGDTKEVEFMNTTDAEIDLSGYKMYKDDGEAAVWVAPAGTKIAAGAFFTLIGDKNATEADYATKFASGMSAKKSIKMALTDAEGNVIDVFMRGQKGSAWGDVTLGENADCSFSRIAIDNSWGAWGYATPTIGAANGEKTAEIEVK